MSHFALPAGGALGAAAAGALLKGLFECVADLDHVLAAVPGGEPLPSPLRASFARAPVEGAAGAEDVFLCSRQHFVPTLYVRGARVEDHDDLAPVFEAQSEVVSGRFGEFFLAESIERQGPRNRVLVGEGPDGRAVGLLSASADVPTQLLQTCFQTAPFGNLVQRSAVLRAHEARASVLGVRLLSDWFSVLGAHRDELQAVFDAVPSFAASGDHGMVSARSNAGAAAASTLSLLAGATFRLGADANEDDEAAAGLGEEDSAPLELGGERAQDAVAVNDVAAVFDHKGDAWGYVGVGGAKLGRTMLVDLGIIGASEEAEKSRAVITRQGLNAAVAAFAERREGVHRRARMAAWFAEPPQVDPAVAEAAAAAAAAEAEAAAAAAAAAPPAKGASKAAAEPVPAAAAPKVEAPPPVGRKLMAEEFDKLVVQLDQERKDNLRALQQAVAAASKEIDAAGAAERAASEAAAKEAYDKELAGDDSVSAADYPGQAERARVRKAEAEARLEAKSDAVRAAQATITQMIRVPLAMYAAALVRRLAVSSALPQTPAVGEEAVAELLPFLAEAWTAARAAGAAAKAAAEAAAAVAGVPPKAVAVDLSDAVAVTKPVFALALEAWERRAMPSAVAPTIVVSSSFARGRPYAIPLAPHEASEAPPAATAAEEAAAQTAAALLGLPHVHLPALLERLALGFAAAEEAVARAIAKILQEEETKRKKEEEAEKKRLAAGIKKKPKAKEEPPRVMPVNTLIDPAADAFGALLQHMQSADGAAYSRGLVLTGAPLQNEEACAALAATLAAGGAPAVLNLHVEEGKFAVASPPREGGAAGAAGGATVAPLSSLASDRMFASARRRRDSCTALDDGSGDAGGAGALSAQRAAGSLGTIVRVEGRRSRLVQLGLAAARAAGGGSSPRGMDRESLAGLLPEPLTATLLREGLLRADPTETAAVASPLSSEEVEREALEGAPNAFVVTLFCLAHAHETRFVDLLAGAFEAFPDREYAVVTQPFAAPDIPLLRRFVQVPPAPSSTLAQTLFVCHRDSLVAPALTSVRRAGLHDRATIRALAARLPYAVPFMDAVVAAERRLHLPLHAAPSAPAAGVARAAVFVAEVDGQCVAVCVLSRTGADAPALDAAALSFALDAIIAPADYARAGAPPGAASLCFVVANPIFMPSLPSVLRTAARLFGGRSALLYRQPASALGPHVASPLPPAVRELFTLVRPRQLPELSPAERAAAEAARAEAAAAAAAEGHFVPRDGVSYAAHSVADLSAAELADPRALDHALYVFATRLSAVPRTTLNSRIVVVGASDAALAAVAQLVLNDGSLRLPHITLLAPGGLPAPRDYFASPAPFTPGREFSGFELARLPLSSHMTIVDDSLAQINRKERSVQLGASRALLCYDALLLLPGLTEATWARLGFESADRLPRGMHSLSHADALAPLAADAEALAEEAAAVGAAFDEDRQVIVFGNSLEALTAISGLLDRGVPGSHILHLRPATAAAAHAAAAAAAALTAGAVAGHDGEEKKAEGQDAAAAHGGGDGEELLEALVPPAPAPQSEAALFAARAVASILEQAGVREITGAELLAVRGELSAGGAGEAQLGADGAPVVSLPGLELDVRRPLRAPPATTASDSKEGSGEEDGGHVAAHSPRGLSYGSDSKDELAEGEGAPPPPPSHETVTLRAALLLCAAERDVEPRFFRAVNDCGVVYDGRLVVDHRFVATDPAIYGGGSVAKFSRRYRAPLNLQSYDSREVGEALAASVLAALGAASGGAGSAIASARAAAGADGVAAGAAATAGAASMAPPPSLLAQLPRFERPKVATALLPGGLHFVSARLPEFDFGPAGREIATHTDARRDASGNGGGVAGLRHTRVLLERFGRVAELTYVGSDAVEARNLSGIVGRSASFLNGLVRRADRQDLPDLIAFLRQGWATGVFHDRFAQLVASLRAAVGADAHVGSLIAQAALLVEQGAPASGDAAGEASDRVSDALKAMADAGVGVGGAKLPPAARAAVEREVLAFLRANRVLNSYAAGR